MKKLIAVIAVLALLALTPVFAGEGYEKCTAGTQECLNKMATHLQHRGMVGVEGEWDDEIGGYRIASFIEGSQAQAAGIEAGDVLIAVNGIPLRDREGSKADSKNRTPGAHAEVTILHNGEKKTLGLELIGLSKQQIAAMIGEHMLQHAEVKVASAD